MAGLFGVLDISARAMQVNQRGISVVGHNIANVDTPGFSRQRQVLAASQSQMRSDGSVGAGVEQLTVQRVVDSFALARLIQEESRSGSLTMEANQLSQIELVFNEQSGGGLSEDVGRLFRGFSDLGNSHSRGEVEREALRAAGDGLVETIHRYDSRLRDIQKSADRALVGLLPEVNSLAQRIATLNEEITAQKNIAEPNDLLDQRDTLLRQLSQKVGITTFEQDNGGVVVMLDGGFAVVEGNRAARFVAQADASNPFDPTFSKIMLDDGINQMDVSSLVSGGELGGLLQTRDLHAANAIRELDGLAFDLAAQINAQHSAGVGLNDAVARDFFTIAGGVNDAARDILLHADIAADSLNIAAAQPPAPALDGDTSNAQAFAGLRIGIQAQVAQIVSSSGQRASSAEFARQQQDRVFREVENQRDAVSAVSIDEEVTDLIRLEASFRANSRIIGAVDEILQELLNIL